MAARSQSGKSRLALIGPEMWAPLTGLITGLILTHEGGPICLTGLGNALLVGPSPKGWPPKG
jgi:hypothetical protein